MRKDLSCADSGAGAGSLAQIRLVASMDAESSSPRGRPASYSGLCFGMDAAVSVAGSDVLALDDEQERKSRLLLLDETSGLPLLDRGAARYRVGRNAAAADHPAPGVGPLMLCAKKRGGSRHHAGLLSCIRKQHCVQARIALVLSGETIPALDAWWPPTLTPDGLAARGWRGARSRSSAPAPAAGRCPGARGRAAGERARRPYADHGEPHRLGKRTRGRASWLP
jgi:hypothetical protein